MSEKDIGHEHTGGMAEFKALLREPPLLISISVVFLLFAVFIIYPFVKILLVPDVSDWIRALTEEEFVLAFAHTLYSSFVATFSAILVCPGSGKEPVPVLCHGFNGRCSSPYSPVKLEDENGSEDYVADYYD